MPYELRKGGGGCKGWAVVKQGSGAVVPGGCHPTRAKAVAHLRALYANVPDAREHVAPKAPRFIK